MADLFDKLQARRDGILAVPAETRRPLTNESVEKVVLKEPYKKTLSKARHLMFFSFVCFHWPATAFFCRM